MLSALVNIKVRQSITFMYNNYNQFDLGEKKVIVYFLALKVLDKFFKNPCRTLKEFLGSLDEFLTVLKTYPILIILSNFRTEK